MQLALRWWQTSFHNNMIHRNGANIPLALALNLARSNVITGFVVGFAFIFSVTRIRFFVMHGERVATTTLGTWLLGMAPATRDQTGDVGNRNHCSAHGQRDWIYSHIIYSKEQTKGIMTFVLTNWSVAKNHYCCT